MCWWCLGANCPEFAGSLQQDALAHLGSWVPNQASPSLCRAKALPRTFGKLWCLGCLEKLQDWGAGDPLTLISLTSVLSPLPVLFSSLPHTLSSMCYTQHKKI